MRSDRVQSNIRLATLLVFAVAAISDASSPLTGRISAFMDWEEYCPHTICQNVANGRFIDNSASCPAFFQCVNGRAYAGECTDGTWFNPVNEHCDVPWNVPCDADNGVEVELECVEKEPEVTVQCRNTSEVHTVQHPTDCSRYFLCVNGLPTVRNCAPGLEFNVETSQCMIPALANCQPPRCPSYNFPVTFLYSNTSCSEFYVCFNGEPVQHLCADGLHWDRDRHWCADPKDAECPVSLAGVLVMNEFL